MKLRRSLAIALILLIAYPPVVSATNCSPFRTWATGDSLSASDLNSSFSTVATTNMSFSCIGDYSATQAQMETTTDPNSAGSVSLATSGAGELERLRYSIQHVFAWSAWWQNYSDVNFRNRSIRNHLATATGYREFFRGEAHLASASTRFHLFSLSIQSYNPGEAHPESLMMLLHVQGTTRFSVGIGGDVHVGSTLGVHATGLQHAPALFNLQRPETGFFWPAYDHLAITAGRVEVARFHGAGMVLAPHAGVMFRHATGALHVNAVSLASGSQVQLGDPNVATTVRGAGLTAAANRLLGFNPTNTGLEAKAISGTSDITITHSAGGMSFAVAAGVNTWGSRGQFSYVGSHATSYVFRLQAHAVSFISASTHAATVRISPSAQDIDIRTTGPAGGGRDRASEFSADSWVHFYWLWDGAAVSGIASAQPPTTGPNLPHSFTSWSYAGAVRHLSAGLRGTHIIGAMAYAHLGVRVLDNGTATSETAVDVASAVPPNATAYGVLLDNNAAGQTLSIRTISGVNYFQRPATREIYAEFRLPNISQRFYYLWATTVSAGLNADVQWYALPNGGN